MEGVHDKWVGVTKEKVLEAWIPGTRQVGWGMHWWAERSQEEVELMERLSEAH